MDVLMSRTLALDSSGHGPARAFWSGAGWGVLSEGEAFAQSGQPPPALREMPAALDVVWIHLQEDDDRELYRICLAEGDTETHYIALIWACGRHTALQQVRQAHPSAVVIECHAIA